MFKLATFATALVVSANAWKRSQMDYFQTEAYGADNQNYGHQGKGYYGKNGEWTVADNHNSYRQTGHQGQGHNQWVAPERLPHVETTQYCIPPTVVPCYQPSHN